MKSLKRALTIAGAVGVMAVAGLASAGPAAASESTPTTTPTVAATTASDVGVLSCPSWRPTPAPGYRCLSWYKTLAGCQRGVAENIKYTASTQGYCKVMSKGAWGYVR